MCGIYGILQLDGAAAPADSLRAMGRLTVHRGPDDEGVHVDGPLALGMRRLSIIDVGGGHQPLSNEDGTLWLVANGEIYNYRELREALIAKGHAFRTASDCETILHLYETYGDACVEHLNGMFAFALWDARRSRLVIGRDRLGVKPLYVCNDGRRLLFASEAKAILAVPGVTAALDPAALSAYLALGYVPAPQSMFRGIAKLPPATMLVAEGGRVEQRRYWRIPSAVDTSRTADDWIAQTRARLEESTRMQMVSDVPIGAFLSGGVDSSAVVAFMAKHSDRPVKTYAIGFGGGDAEAFYNELPYARRVAELFGTDHHEIVVRPDVVALLPRLLWHMDEPIADTAFITTYLVSQFARRDVTVILSGVGGDELFGGYRRYLGSHYQAYFDRLPAPLRRAATALGQRLPSDRHSPLLNAMRLAKGFLSDGGPADRGALPFLRRGVLRGPCGRAAARAAQRRTRGAGRGVRACRRHRRAQPDARRRCGDAAARRPAAPDRQDEHGGVARMPRAAARPRAGRARGAHSAGRQDPRRPVEARDEGGAEGRASRRHPRPQEARLRHADGRVAQAAIWRRWSATCCRRTRSTRAACSAPRRSTR